MKTLTTTAFLVACTSVALPFAAFGQSADAKYCSALIEKGSTPGAGACLGTDWNRPVSLSRRGKALVAALAALRTSVKIDPSSWSSR